MTVYRDQGTQKAFDMIQKGEGLHLNQLLMKKIESIEQAENRHLNKQRMLIQTTQKKTTLFIMGTSIFGFFLTCSFLCFPDFGTRKNNGCFNLKSNKKNGFSINTLMQFRMEFWFWIRRGKSCL